ncbi:hypothetical protein NQ314_003416 [Rhamnusium bicolor]|uniref:DUF8206 domain-containing protein n=1 Tax=Rhamnusium bicolor TaxID=1586634 RepID=A0AAV8ZNW7_9CUCU|nr:hypothetical protein NQ314_003416 [Rhamnusium bicolor]
MEELPSHVNPAKLNIRINNTKAIQVGLLINCENDDSFCNLKGAVANKFGDRFNISEPTKFNPRIIITNVDIKLTFSSEEFIEDIILNNSDLKDCKQEIKFITKLNRKFTQSTVMQVQLALNNNPPQMCSTNRGVNFAANSDSINIVSLGTNNNMGNGTTVPGNIHNNNVNYDNFSLFNMGKLVPVFDNDCDTYEHFKKEFSENFWQQHNIRSQLEGAEYKEGLFVDHINHWIAMAKHLQPPYTPEKLIEEIATHFRPSVAGALMRATTLSQAITRLRHADAYYKNSSCVSINLSDENLMVKYYKEIVVIPELKNNHNFAALDSINVCAIVSKCLNNIPGSCQNGKDKKHFFRTDTKMASDESDIDKNLELNKNTDINILLLGETGVGKSTFINSIVNYLTYTDLKNAEKENLLSLIPSIFQVIDKHGKYHIIQIGSERDQNEYLETGESATQNVKTYVFPIWNEKKKVRLIDTPGMGDTRGIEQDDINCENILSYIGQLHELHAICFLFKPTNTRITAFFKYCMAQIFSRLDKSASKNIIFIFTNTRGADYGPGDTFRILEKIVNDIKSGPSSVDIPLNRNVFCFDNEAFKYLAAVKEGVNFENSVKLRIRESWRKSAGECWRLIKYIVGDKSNPPLEPHFIKSTSAINEARRIITQLSQPLAEIVEFINVNLLCLQRQQENLDVSKNSLKELKKNLYMPVVTLDITTLTCHDPCYLKNVPKELIGAPELLSCAAMNGKRTCTRCECDFSVHMHIYYMTKTKEIREIDPNVQKNVDNKGKVIENANKLIEDIIKRKMEFEKEHDVIVKSCAQFAHFLQNNAITPFNDSYKDYINYLIIRENSLGVLCNKAVVQHLEKLIRKYEEEKKSFDEALKIQKELGETDLVTPQKIQETVQELYKLKHNGKNIKELCECQKKSRNKEHAYTEYVHKIVLKQSDKSEKKQKKKNKKENDAQKNRTQKRNTVTVITVITTI